jgi:cytochrome c peroxidase
MSGRIAVAVAIILALVAPMAPAALAQGPGDKVTLGKAIFFDTNLSVNGTQSCASCHAPAVGYTGPDSQVNASGAVYPGAIPTRFGNRKPPAAAYAGDSPGLHYDEIAREWVGGMFWDGRATGGTLGDPLAEQAQGPFLNPLEQAMPDARAVCTGVAVSTYADLFEEVWGPGSLGCTGDVGGAYERIARSIAAYERSPEVNPFSSKFDLFWDKAKKARKDVTKIKIGSSRDPYRWQAYRGLGLTDTELQGLAAFNDPNRANCASCHALTPGPAGYPLFTDFSYHNLGVPKNPANPFYTMPPKWNPDGQNWVDYGLGGYLKSAGYAPAVYEPELGKFKVPTLRNVDLRPSSGLVKAYAHNGYFKSLPDILRFYAWRGMMGGGCGMGGGGMGGGGMGGGGCGGGGCGGGGGGCGGMGGSMFPGPEVSQNLATLKMVNMMDQSNLLAFLKTLSDGYFQR